MVERAMREAGLEALELSALHLLGAAQRDAPIDEGTLRGAGTFWIEESADGAIAVVAFPLVYAAVQEREEDFAHPRGGKAHYLGDNLKALAPRFRQALERSKRKALRRV